MPLVLLLALLFSFGCTQDTRSGDNKGPPPTASPLRRPIEGVASKIFREQALLQLLFTMRSTKARPPWLGCQLHLLARADGAQRVALDLGDGRTHTGFPLAKKHRRMPALFPYSYSGKEKLVLEFHTSLPQRRRTVVVGPVQGTTKHVDLPYPLPPRWSFACVLRRQDGPGSLVDGVFRDGKPIVLGSRTKSRAQLAPGALQTLLNQRLGKWQQKDRE